MQAIMGIDPGSVSGAWAFLYDDGEMTAGDLPVTREGIDGAALARLIGRGIVTLAIVERVGPMPKQGVSSTFKFGAAYGCILGVLAACHVPVRLVAPTLWKKHYRLNSDKEGARALAIRLWPNCPQFGRKRDHGRAEAALMAKWGAGV